MLNNPQRLYDYVLYTQLICFTYYKLYKDKAHLLQHFIQSLLISFPRYIWSVDLSSLMYSSVYKHKAKTSSVRRYIQKFKGCQTKHLIFQSGRIQLINKLPQRFRISQLTKQIWIQLKFLHVSNCLHAYCNCNACFKIINRYWNLLPLS